VRYPQFRTIQRALLIIGLCFVLLIFSVAGVLAIADTTPAHTIHRSDTNATYSQSITGIISTNINTVLLCVPLLGPCTTPTPKPTATPKPTDTPEPTATPKPTDTPEPTATPKPAATPTRAAQPTPTKAPTVASTATAAAGANPPVQSSTPVPSVSITPTVTPTAVATTATKGSTTDTGTTATSNAKTNEQGKNKNSLSGVLLPIGGVSFMMLATAGALVALLFRRRQLQKNLLLAPQASASANSWANHNEANAAFGQSAMGTPAYPTENTVLVPDAVTPAMQSPVSMYTAEAGVEDHATIAQPPPFMLDSMQTQQTPLAESEMASPAPSSLYSPAQDATLLSPEEDPAVPPAEAPPYTAPDMEPLTMNLPEDVVSDLVKKKTDVLPPQQQGLQDDPFLEAMMRQAQMGLFALPDKEPAESTPGGDSSRQQ
jgi:hypothetical protein